MSTQNQTRLPLIDAWKQFVKVHDEQAEINAECNTLSVEIIKAESKIRARSSAGDEKLVVVRDKLRIKRSMLVAQADKVYTEAYAVWIDAIIETYGADISVQRRYSDKFTFVLGNGEVYTVEMGRS